MWTLMILSTQDRLTLDLNRAFYSLAQASFAFHASLVQSSMKLWNAVFRLVACSL